MVEHSTYTIGGNIQGGMYIKRKADDKLMPLCRTGDFAFVCSSRHMGKSSLIDYAAKKLMQEGIQSAIIDLSAFGKNNSEDSWYLNILDEIFSREAI